MRRDRVPTRMPNPKKPFIELTVRNQALAAAGILFGSYLLSNAFIHNGPPQQPREFTTNFDPAAIVVAPEPPSVAKPTIETEMFVTPEEPPPAESTPDRHSL